MVFFGVLTEYSPLQIAFNNSVSGESLLRDLPPLKSTPCIVMIFSQDEHNPNLCSKKDDIYGYEKSYKIIVGSATDTRDGLLYYQYRGKYIAFTIESHPFTSLLLIDLWFQLLN